MLSQRQLLRPEDRSFRYPYTPERFMKKTRRRYDRAFKISVVAELESGKPLAQIAREHSIHPGLPTRWREELTENPEKAFRKDGAQGQRIPASSEVG